MNKLSKAWFLVVVLLLLGQAEGRAAGEPPLQVLLIGNSCTSVNDLPALVGGEVPSASDAGVAVNQGA